MPVNFVIGLATCHRPPRRARCSMRAIRRAAGGESGTIDVSRGGGSCMINKTVLLLAVAAGLAAARPGSAQSALSDVPAQHWANGAVKELQLRGSLTGYPDGTLG